MAESARGRRSGDPAVTRQAILDAARQEFAANGFDRTTIRAIATAAGVDPSLIMHYFGNKRTLFATAHDVQIDADAVIEAILATPREHRGAVIVRFYLGFLLAPESPAIAMLRSAASDDKVATMMREFIADTLLERAPQIAPGARPGLRLSLIATHCLGVAFGRQIIGVAPLVQTDVDELVALVAPVAQRYLDLDLDDESD